MPLCECCGKEGADLRCGRCHMSWYCSTVCQKKHWKAGHRTKCVKKCVEADKPTKATRAAAATPHAVVHSVSDASTAAGSEEECAICLDALQQPQTLPCSHRFCRGCVAGMRERGVGATQVCPLCRGPMPDAERLGFEASRMLTQFDRWQKGERKGAPQPPWVQELRPE